MPITPLSKSSQKIWDIFFSILPIPVEMDGSAIRRKEPCRMCKSLEGKQVAEINYWDLESAAVVQCTRCKLIQLDPMLSHDAIDKGCYAYHIQENLNVPIKEQTRNLFSNFRKGINFANHLKSLGICPKDILEFGPGSGYFCAGIKYVFPHVIITVVDIVEDVLDRIEAVHGFKTIKGTPETFEIRPDVQFDLIIARDIIEHVIDISKTIQTVLSLLRHDGIFHFITPNGYEDVWRFYTRYKMSKTPGDLSINHVNYFDGKGLREFLLDHNLKPVEYYTYKVKTTIRGTGWRINEKIAADSHKGLSAQNMIDTNSDENNSIIFDKDVILNRWPINTENKLLIKMYCWYKNCNSIKLSPDLNIGHEIFGLFRKKNGNEWKTNRHKN